MSSDEDGGARIVDALEQVDDFGLSEDVEICGRLVGNEDFRLSGDGAGDSDALDFSAGEGGGKLFGFILQFDDFEDLGDGIFNLS